MPRVVLGIVGGVAAGKSTVTKYLHEEWRVPIISADPLAHKALMLPEILDQLSFRWGQDYPRMDEAMVRHQVRLRVFGDAGSPGDVEFIEAIIHPIVTKWIDEKLSLYHPKYGGLVILDAPLLFEAGLNKRCNHIWYVDMPEKDRLRNFIARMKSGGKLTFHTPLEERTFEDQAEKDFKAREKRLQVEKKRKWADTIIKNNFGSIEFTHRAVLDEYEKLFAEAKR